LLLLVLSDVHWDFQEIGQVGVVRQVWKPKKA